jgi:hypothetical protein
MQLSDSDYPGPTLPVAGQCYWGFESRLGALKLSLKLREPRLPPCLAHMARGPLAGCPGQPRGQLEGAVHDSGPVRVTVGRT